MRLGVLGIATLGLAFIFSCSKGGEDPRGFDTRTLPQEVKDFTYFKDSTYWVYQDSASSAIDSFFVFDSKYIFSMYYDNTGLPKAEFEVFQYFTKSSLDGFTYYYLTDFNTNRYNEYPKVKILRAREKGGSNVVNHFFYHPMEEGKEYTYDGSKMKLTARVPSITFNNTTYTDVLIYDDAVNATENDNRTTFYVARNMGIIRKEIHNTKRKWNLVRHRIVQ